MSEYARVRYTQEAQNLDGKRKVCSTLKFITIGYGDESGYNRTPNAARAAAHEHDGLLREAGAIMGTAGKPIQVRNPNATGVQTMQGSYMRAELPVAGFALIEASSLEEAIEMVAKTPCAVAHGVVEVWPFDS